MNINKNSKFDSYTGRQAPVAHKAPMTQERAQFLFQNAFSKVKSK